LARSGGTRGRRIQGRSVGGSVLVCQCCQPGGRRAWGAGSGRPAGALACSAVVLPLDVGQAFGELAISDPDDVHTAHVPLAPVIAPAHHRTLGAVGELLLDGEPGLSADFRAR
jgi:hypothetical protein